MATFRASACERPIARRMIACIRPGHRAETVVNRWSSMAILIGLTTRQRTSNGSGA